LKTAFNGVIRVQNVVVFLQRDAMNHSLFNPEVLKRYCGPGGRVIIFAFARAAGKLIGRLLESARE
jgi:hypothetical protein